MALLETFIVGIGSSIAKTALKKWISDNAPFELAASESIVDVVKDKTKDYIAKRSLKRKIEEISEVAATTILNQIEKRKWELSETEIKKIANAARSTLDSVDFNSKLLAEKKLDPSELTNFLLELPGSKGGNPKYASTETGDKHTIYYLILSEATKIIIDLSENLPHFTRDTLAEILKKDHEILEITKEICARIDLYYNTTADTNLASLQFEADYRHAVNLRLNELQLFGLEVNPRNKRYSLSVAYITLETEVTIPVGAKSQISAGSLPADSIIQKFRRVLVRGRAGSGKTTLLQWLAVSAANRRLTLSDHDSDLIIPFFIRLRDFATSQLPKPDLFHAQISQALPSPPKNWVSDILSKGNGLILVDGIDEVSEDNRSDSWQWIEDLIHLYPDNHFVITSRPHASEHPNLDELQFAIANISDMTRENIESFVVHWHDAIKSKNENPDEISELDRLADSLTKKLRTQRSLEHLATNPLLCAIICALNRDRTDNLPNERSELYRACIDMLFRRESDRKIDLPEYCKLSDPQKYLILQNLALWMTRNGWSNCDKTESISRIQDALMDLQERPPLLNGHDTLRLFVERTSILRDLPNHKIDFPHRTFQEYFSALALIEENSLQELINNAHQEQWREIAILASGIKGTDSETLVGGLVQRGDKEKNAEMKSSLHLLAGAALDTALAIPAHSMIPDNVADRLAKIIPPKTIQVAKGIASAGDNAAPLLSPEPKWSDTEKLLGARALATIDSSESELVLNSYLSPNWLNLQRDLFLGKTRALKDKSSALSVIHLDLSPLEDEALQSFSRISSCTELRSLDISGIPITNLEPIQSCRKLRKLTMRETLIDKLSPLRRLDRLESLIASSSPIESLSDLEDLRALREIDLSHTLVRDFDFVLHHPRISTVIAIDCPIVDFSPFRFLPTLETLHISKTSFSDPSVLSGFIALSSLDISATEIGHSPIFPELPSLGELVLNQTRIKELEGFPPIVGLSHLDLSDTEITEIPEFDKFPNLNMLDISGTEIENFEPLNAFRGLKTLIVDEIQFSSFDFSKTTSAEIRKNSENEEQEPTVPPAKQKWWFK